MTKPARDLNNPRQLPSDAVLSELSSGGNPAHLINRLRNSDPVISPADTENLPLLERIQEKKRLMKAAIELEGGAECLGIDIVKTRLEELDELFGVLRDPYRARLEDCIQRIANPTRETLESNGQYLRRVARLDEFPDIERGIRKFLSEEYWLLLPGYVGGKASDLVNARFNLHPALHPHFLPTGRSTRFDYGGILTLLALTDPRLEVLVSQIPLPDEDATDAESARRSQLRERLTEEGKFSFGQEYLYHFNHNGFDGDVLFTQRVLDRLGFRGQLRLEPGNQRMAFEVLPEGFQWQTAEDLKRGVEQGDPAAIRARYNLATAARKNGFHVVGEYYENAVLDIFGLDDRISWYLDSWRPKGRSSTYGDEAIRCKLTALPGAYIVLGDEVELYWDTKPQAIPLFQRVMISIPQFQELVLDRVEIAQNGETTLKTPNLSSLALTDNRWEVQTRGCLSLV